jgi:probable phosphoglycerate mutase
MARPRDFTDFTLDASERACFDLALSYCDSGFLSIIDGVFEDVDVLASEELRFARCGYKLFVVSLVAEMSDLIERNNVRDPLQRMDESRLRDLHARFQVAGSVLPIRGKMPEEVCDDLLDIIEEQRPQVLEPLVARDEVDVLFLRHGAADHPKGAYADLSTRGLSRRGRAEARAARRAVLRFAPDAVFSSDVAYTVETAKLATVGSGLKVEITEALRGWAFAKMMGQESRARRAELGRSVEGVLASDNDLVELPGEESYADASARVFSFFDNLTAHYGGKRVLVVGHAGPHHWLLERALGVDIRGVRCYRWDTGSFSRFTLSPERARLGGLNLSPSAVAPDLDVGAGSASMFNAWRY